VAGLRIGQEPVERLALDVASEQLGTLSEILTRRAPPAPSKANYAWAGRAYTRKRDQCMRERCGCRVAVSDQCADQGLPWCDAASESPRSASHTQPTRQP
jgi:hypothetical protein